MSMYGVNASVPKTLVRYLVKFVSDQAKEDGLTVLSEVLEDILDTPVSPELIPADENGEIAQISMELCRLISLCRAFVTSEQMSTIRYHIVFEMVTVSM